MQLLLASARTHLLRMPDTAHTKLCKKLMLGGSNLIRFDGKGTSGCLSARYGSIDPYFRATDREPHLQKYGAGTVMRGTADSSLPKY